jgi:ribosomal protein S18 acetylase RimI-like enzyme
MSYEDLPGDQPNSLIEGQLARLRELGFDTDPLGPNRNFLLELDQVIESHPMFGFLYVELLCLETEIGTVETLERLRSFVTICAKYPVGRELILRASQYSEKISNLREYIHQQSDESGQLQIRLKTIERDLVEALDQCIKVVLDISNIGKLVSEDYSLLDVFDSNTASMQLLLKAFRAGVVQDMSPKDQEQFLGITIEFVNRPALIPKEREYVEQLYRSQLGNDRDKVNLKLGTFTERIDNPLSRIGLIMLDQKIVGALILSPNDSKGSELYGSSLVIDPAFIGTGCMLPYIQQLLEDAGKDCDIVGDVFTNNTVALNFYAKLGFVRDVIQPANPEYPLNGIRLRRPANAIGTRQ